MKQISILLLIVVATNLQAQDCAEPMPKATYQVFFNQIAQQTSNGKKLERAYETINAGCLLLIV